MGYPWTKRGVGSFGAGSRLHPRRHGTLCLEPWVEEPGTLGQIGSGEVWCRIPVAPQAAWDPMPRTMGSRAHYQRGLTPVMPLPAWEHPGYATTSVGSPR